MPDSAESLYEAASSRGALFGPVATSPPDPFMGLFGNNPLASFAAMQALGAMGLQMPYGFRMFDGQNLMSTIDARRRDRIRRQAQIIGYRADQPAMQDTILGALVGVGGQVTPESVAMAKKMAADVTAVVPFAAMMAPRLVDELYGGSGSIGLMTQNLAARQEQRLSGLTGRADADENEISERAKRLYTALYTGPGGQAAATARMRGFRAGEAGEIIGQLEDMGLVTSYAPSTGQDQGPLARGAARVANAEHSTALARRYARKSARGRTVSALLRYEDESLGGKPLEGALGRITEGLRKGDYSVLTGVTEENLRSMAYRSNIAQDDLDKLIRDKNRTDAVGREYRVGDAVWTTSDAAAAADIERSVATAKKDGGTSERGRTASAILRYEDEVNEGKPLSGTLGRITEGLRKGDHTVLSGVTAENLRSMARQSGISSDELNKLIQDERQTDAVGRKYGVGDAVWKTSTVAETADIEHSAAQIKKYAGALSAIRDVLGDAGHPNAPVPVLFQALKALTQGGVGNMSPDEMERQVRTMAVGAKRAGMSIDSLAGMLAQTGEYAQAVGVSRTVAPTIMGSALAFNAALRDTNITGEGRLTREEYMMHDARLRVNAGASAMGRTVSAILRYEDEVNEGKPLAGPLGKITEGLRKGDSSVLTGMTVEKLRSMAYQSDITQGELGELIQDKGRTDAVGRKYGVSDAVRATSQSDELQNLIRSRLAGVFRAGMKRGGGDVSPEERADIAAQTLVNLGPEFTGTYEQQLDLVEQAIEAHGGAPGMSVKERRALAVRGLAAVRRETEKRLGKDLSAELDLHRRTTHADAAQRLQEAHEEAAVQTGASRVVAGTPIRRVVDALRKLPRASEGAVKDATSLQSVLKTVMGAVADEDVTEGLQRAASRGSFKDVLESSPKGLLGVLAQGYATIEEEAEAARAKGATDEDIEEKFGDRFKALMSDRETATKVLRNKLKDRGLTFVEGLKVAGEGRTQADADLLPYYIATQVNLGDFARGDEEDLRRNADRLRGRISRQDDEADLRAGPGESTGDRRLDEGAKGPRTDVGAAPPARESSPSVSPVDKDVSTQRPDTRAMAAPSKKIARRPAGYPATANQEWRWRPARSATKPPPPTSPEATGVQQVQGQVQDGNMRIELSGEVVLRDDKLDFANTQGTGFTVPVLKGRA